MKIVVCVKQVPDTASERTLDPADNTLDRAKVDGVLNELDEYAVEEALRLAEAHGGDVTVLSVHVEHADTHMTLNPVAVNYQCWAARRASAHVSPDGSVEYERDA